MDVFRPSSKRVLVERSGRLVVCALVGALMCAVLACGGELSRRWRERGWYEATAQVRAAAGVAEMGSASRDPLLALLAPLPKVSELVISGIVRTRAADAIEPFYPNLGSAVRRRLVAVETLSPSTSSEVSIVRLRVRRQRREQADFAMRQTLVALETTYDEQVSATLNSAIDAVADAPVARGAVPPITSPITPPITLLQVRKAQAIASFVVEDPVVVHRAGFDRSGLATGPRLLACLLAALGSTLGALMLMRSRMRKNPLVLRPNDPEAILEVPCLSGDGYRPDRSATTAALLARAVPSGRNAGRVIGIVTVTGTGKVRRAGTGRPDPAVADGLAADLMEVTPPVTVLAEHIATIPELRSRFTYVLVPTTSAATNEVIDHLDTAVLVVDRGCPVSAIEAAHRCLTLGGVGLLGYVYRA